MFGKDKIIVRFNDASGTMTVLTEGVSDVNHANADNLLDEIERVAGGGSTITRNDELSGESHSHSHDGHHHTH